MDDQDRVARRQRYRSPSMRDLSASATQLKSPPPQVPPKPSRIPQSSNSTLPRRRVTSHDGFSVNDDSTLTSRPLFRRLRAAESLTAINNAGAMTSSTELLQPLTSPATPLLDNTTKRQDLRQSNSASMTSLNILKENEDSVASALRDDVTPHRPKFGRPMQNRLRYSSSSVVDINFDDVTRDDSATNVDRSAEAKRIIQRSVDSARGKRESTGKPNQFEDTPRGNRLQTTAHVPWNGTAKSADSGSSSGGGMMYAQLVQSPLQQTTAALARAAAQSQAQNNQAPSSGRKAFAAPRQEAQTELAGDFKQIPRHKPPAAVGFVSVREKLRRFESEAASQAAAAPTRTAAAAAATAHEKPLSETRRKPAPVVPAKPCLKKINSRLKHEQLAQQAEFEEAVQSGSATQAPGFANTRATQRFVETNVRNRDVNTFNSNVNQAQEVKVTNVNSIASNLRRNDLNKDTSRECVIPTSEPNVEGQMFEPFGQYDVDVEEEVEEEEEEYEEQEGDEYEEDGEFEDESRVSSRAMEVGDLLSLIDIVIEDYDDLKAKMEENRNDQGQGDNSTTTLIDGPIKMRERKLEVTSQSDFNSPKVNQNKQDMNSNNIQANTSRRYMPRFQNVVFGDHSRSI